MVNEPSVLSRRTFVVNAIPSAMILSIESLVVLLWVNCNAVLPSAKAAFRWPAPPSNASYTVILVAENNRDRKNGWRHIFTLPRPQMLAFKKRYWRQQMSIPS
jgi:hypothetical protein